MPHNVNLSNIAPPLCDQEHLCPGLPDHCRVGEHCATTDATCSLDVRHDDHEARCCFCRRPVHQ